MRNALRLGVIVTAVSVVLVAVDLDAGRLHALDQAGPVTFARDVAPIVFENCVSCHRTGGSAPFSLLSYEDVKARAERIAAVTQTGYMPPWKPEPGYGDFADARRLSPPQLELIQRWVVDGAPLGDPSLMPSPPHVSEHWQLGTPDLVVTMGEPFTVPAAGGDVYRHFVIPIPLPERKFVSAWELRAGNSPVLHHATMEIDQTGMSRHLDMQDPAPGYEGLIAHTTMAPDGYFLDWAPGHSPYRAPDGMAFPIEGGSDLVMMLHLRPIGRPVPVQVSVAFYFSDAPPTRVPALLRLTRQDLDIPAGAARYEVRNTFRTPVDLDVFTTQPHAHNLAKEIEAFALLPDGRREPLLLIREWDFNWQGVYRYAQPVFLPAGTTVTARWVYDNSDANSRNPTRPAQPVRFGQRTSDEMAEVWFQVVPRTAADRTRLTRAMQSHLLPENIKGYEMMIRAEPDNASLHDDVALLYAQVGDLDRAVEHFAETARIRPGVASAYYNVGNAQLLRGKRQEARLAFERAIEIDPTYANAHRGLGTVLYRDGQLEDAVRAYGRAVQLAPGDIAAQHNLAVVLQAQGRLAEAVTHYEEVLRLDARYPDAHYGLALVLKSQGNMAGAAQHYRAALQSVPNWPEVLVDLAWLLAASPDPAVRSPQEAIELAERAVNATNPPSWAALDASAAALASAGRVREAADRARRALESAVAAGNDAAAGQIRERLRSYDR